MRYLSVCSGIEAASVAWHHLGWTPVAFSEIEPFPSAVLAHRFPDVPNLGDMTKNATWPVQPGDIDLLVGGTPCQSFSVAGLRKGISDPRGGLMLTYIEIARCLRPRWIVWENVPGVLSSGRGRDFGSFLGALGELGYGWAYRVLDAQWVRTQRHPRAVPQRRRRVFVVGCLGDWRAAAAVLFERESVLRDTASRRASRKGAAADAEGGAQGGGIVTSHGVAPCLETTSNDYSRADGFTMVAQPTEWPAECAGTLGQSASGSGSPGYSNQEIFSQHGANLVPQPVPYDLFQITAPVNRQNRKPGDPCHTLARDNAMYTLTKADTHAVAFTPGNLARGAGASPNAEVFPTLKCSEGRGADDQRPCVAFQQNQLGEVRCNTVAGTVNTNSNASGRNTPMVAIGNDVHAVAFPINTMTIGGRPDPRNDARMTMGVGDNDDAQFTLSKAHSHALAHAFYSTGGTHGVNQHPEVSPAVKVGSGLGIPSPPAVAFTVGNAARGQGPGPNTEVFPTLKSGGGRGTDDQWPSVMTAMTVRRLTPVECERLQGFPDNWTAIPWRGKTADQCPDGPRYKALGNSMACNCMAWIGERIAEWEAR